MSRRRTTPPIPSAMRWTWKLWPPAKPPRPSGAPPCCSMTFLLARGTIRRWITFWKRASWSRTGASPSSRMPLQAGGRLSPLSIGPTAAPPPSSLWRICPSTMFPAGPNTPRPCAGPMSRAWCPDGRTEPFTAPPMLPGRSWPWCSTAASRPPARAAGAWPPSPTGAA